MIPLVEEFKCRRQEYLDLLSGSSQDEVKKMEIYDSL